MDERRDDDNRPEMVYVCRRCGDLARGRTPGPACPSCTDRAVAMVAARPGRDAAFAAAVAPPIRRAFVAGTLTRDHLRRSKWYKHAARSKSCPSRPPGTP